MDPACIVQRVVHTKSHGSFLLHRQPLETDEENLEGKFQIWLSARDFLGMQSWQSSLESKETDPDWVCEYQWHFFF